MSRKSVLICIFKILVASESLAQSSPLEPAVSELQKQMEEMRFRDGPNADSNRRVGDRQRHHSDGLQCRSSPGSERGFSGTSSSIADPTRCRTSKNPQQFSSKGLPSPPAVFWKEQWKLQP